MDDNNRTLGKTKEDIRKSQVKSVKAAVEMTFEALDEMERQKSILQDKIRILKHDLYDLKDGRLDRIVERQSLCNGNSISAFAVKLVEGQSNSVSNWYTEYELEIGKDGDDLSYRINNSILKQHASGTYKLKNGEVKYL